MSDGSEITTDGKTVWVNGSDGMCLGRFSRVGIDIHRNFEEQAAGLGQCLECAHEPTDHAGWRRFVEGMARHHGIAVADRHMPGFLK